MQKKEQIEKRWCEMKMRKVEKEEEQRTKNYMYEHKIEKAEKKFKQYHIISPLSFKYKWKMCL